MTESLESIYRRHQHGLYSLALAITRNRAAAEDAVHDALMQLCKRPDLWQELEAGTPYLYAAVRNAALDQARKGDILNRYQEAIFNGQVRPQPDDPTHSTELNERDRLIRTAIEALPGEQREIVVMRIYGELTFAEIAETTGEPLGTVNGRYRRALDRLRDKLEEWQ